MDSMVETKRVCPVCGETSARLLLTIDYPRAAVDALPSRYRICACGTCGMVYDDFDADASVFARYYSEAGKYAMPVTGGSGGLSANDLDRYGRLIDILEPFFCGKDVSIADIGCAKGGLLKCLWDRGYANLCGIDASPDCIRMIRKTYPFPAICSTLEEIDRCMKFDVIVLSQVLEHLFCPARALSIVWNLLKPGGVLYCDVPDAARYADFMPAPFYYFDKEHINHFYGAPLEGVMEANGFSVQKTVHNTNRPVPEMLHPNLAMVAARKESVPAYAPPPPGDIAPILRYIEKSRQRERTLPSLSDLSGSGWLWGIGAYCQRLIEAGAFSNLHLLGLIDLDPTKQGKVISGLEVVPPAVLRTCEDRETFVIVTSVLYYRQIEKTLRESGFRGKIVLFC